MKLNIKDLKKQQSLRLNFSKIEKKKKILKSILKSRSILAKTRILAIIDTHKIKKKSLAFLHQNICFLTNKHKSNFKKFNLSRHSFKRYLILNKIQNIKVKSW
jgi:hypothetical protein